MCGHFRRQIEGIANETTWACLCKEYVMRENELLLMASENIVVRINNVKNKIDKSKGISK